MRKLLPIITILGLGLITALPVLAAVELEVQYPPFGPEGAQPGGGPASWVRYIFLLALALTSIAAVGSLIYAGIVWMTSASSERVREAQKRIWAAVGGIVLVAGSVVILRTINPDLVTLHQPTLESIRGRFQYRTTFGRVCEAHVQCQAGQFCHPQTGKCVFQYSGQSGVGQSCAGIGDIACGGDLRCDPTTVTCQGGGGGSTGTNCGENSFYDAASKQCNPRLGKDKQCNPGIANQCQDGLSCKRVGGGPSGDVYECKP